MCVCICLSLIAALVKEFRHSQYDYEREAALSLSSQIYAKFQVFDLESIVGKASVIIPLNKRKFGKGKSFFGKSFIDFLSAEFPKSSQFLLRILCRVLLDEKYILPVKDAHTGSMQSDGTITHHIHTYTYTYT